MLGRYSYQPQRSFWSAGLMTKMKGHNIGNLRMATLRFYITQTINGRRKVKRETRLTLSEEQRKRRGQMKWNNEEFGISDQDRHSAQSLEEKLSGNLKWGRKVSDSTEKMPVPNPKQRLKQSKFIIPVHACPVPLYPSLHVHLYEP